MENLPTLRDEKWDGRERAAHQSVRASERVKSKKTIRETREKLTSESGHSRDFDREILANTARNYRAATPVLTLLIIFVGCFGLTWLNYFGVLIWISANLFAQVLIVNLARRYLKGTPKEPSTLAKWYNTFVYASFLSGLIWSTFLLIPVSTPSLSQPVFTFTTLLVAVAIYCFINAPLTMGMLATTIPITIILIIQFGLSSYTSLFMMAGLFIGAHLLFIIMASQIKKNLIQVFTIRAEKDSLILELEEATAISEESRRRAEEANLAKSRFLATMSHELRTPLNAIIGFSEIMKEGLLGPIDNKSYKEYVADIHSSGDHLLNLINEILDLSRIEAGRYDLNEEAVTLIDVVDDCYSLIEIRARNKDIKITINAETNMPRIWVDQRAVRQIILNLMSNAVKFTPQGGEITVYAGWTAGGGQYVSVRDNGPGIPEEEIPIVLSQFGQGSSAIKSAEQGTGLGLPICQALINMHGGTFDLKSKLRAGTIVTVTFPRARIMQALAPMNDKSADESSSQRSGFHKMA